MDNTAYISFEHGLEDGWYRMKEPTGENDTWGHWQNAVALAQSMGWEVKWKGPQNDPYMPTYFKQESSF